MKDLLRAVLDTNVILASQRTAHPTSPNREISDRWLAGEFTLLVSDDIAVEYAEKLHASGKDPARIESFLADVFLLAEFVEIRFFHFRHYPVDADDISFLLCAANGAASHLVSYDQHLLDIGVFYEEFCALNPLEFLQELREG